MIVIAELRLMSGIEHKRLIALSYGAIIESIISFTDVTEVYFKNVSDKDIAWYVENE